MDAQSFFSGRVIISKAICIELDAKQWCLYDDPTADVKAKFINRQLEVMFDNVSSRKEAIKQGEEILRKHNDVGAGDTEPRQVLYALVDIMFKDVEK